MIEKAAPDEIFTILKWHLEIRIYELIDYLASTSDHGDLKAVIFSVEDVCEIITSNEIDDGIVSSMTPYRKNQPLLVAHIQNESWLIDGNHRLKKKVEDGDADVEVIIVPNALLYDFCQPFMNEGSARRQRKLMANIADLLQVSS